MAASGSRSVDALIHRDATFSRATRDKLAAAARALAVAGHHDLSVSAREIVAHWDANDATEIIVEVSDHGEPTGLHPVRGSSL